MASKRLPYSAAFVDGIISLFDVKGFKQEHIGVATFGKKNELLGFNFITSGNSRKVTFHVLDPFRRAVNERVKKIVIVHNHPNSECRPSRADKKAFTQLRKYGDVLDVDVADQIIVGPTNTFYSYKLGKKIAVQKN